MSCDNCTSRKDPIRVKASRHSEKARFIELAISASNEPNESARKKRTKIAQIMFHAADCCSSQQEIEELAGTISRTNLH